MSVSILDEIVADLHMKHGEEASHILPEHRVGSAQGCCSNSIHQDAALLRTSALTWGSYPI
jgi:hypothetical protein